MLQHEIDHLDGVLILDRAPREQRKAALRALREGGSYSPPAEDERAAEGEAQPPRAAHRRVRTAYLGTSDFAATVLRAARRLAAPSGAGRDAARPPAGPRPAQRRRRRWPRPRAELGIELLQAEDVNDEAALERIRAAGPRRSRVCAFGQLIREPLLSELAAAQRPSLAAAALARGGADRAGDHGRRRAHRGLRHAGHRRARLRPGRPARGGARSAPRTTSRRSPSGSRRSAASCWSRAFDLQAAGQLEFAEQDEDAATYAEKIDPAERRLDPARPAAELARTVRALTPHIGAYLELADGERLGVRRARAGRRRRAHGRGEGRVGGAAARLRPRAPCGWRSCSRRAAGRWRPTPTCAATPLPQML